MNKLSRLLLFSFVFSIFFVTVSALDCYDFDGNQSGCTTGAAADVCEWGVEHGEGICDPKGCWDFSTNVTCTNASNSGIACSWNAGGSFCEETRCNAYDGTNASFCVNNTKSQPCNWDAGNSVCYDKVQGCSDFDTSGECFGTNFCEWNSTACVEPEGENFGGNDEGAGCFMFNNEALCKNVTTCSWSGGVCTGESKGIICGNVNQSTHCNSISFLGTCCAWQGTSCNSTFSTSCWDNLQAPPTGANFCEDYLAINNESLCDQIAGSPWYMPCKWDNRSTATTTDDQCAFNGANFFDDIDGGGHYEDIDSKSTCEAAGGQWKTETWVKPDGSTKKDSWCEMKFGVGAESCDSACWACEYENDGSVWSSEAELQSACQSSKLGYCKYRTDTTAPNGFGICEKPGELKKAGCGAETSCEDYKFYTNPQASCNNDSNCKWFTDPVITNFGWCSGANTKSCDQSCGACEDTTACTSYGPNCQWDANLGLCKAQGGSGDAAEICFDGSDNDNDGMIDCADPNCFNDQFCGGTGGSNCGQYGANGTCLGDTNCIWMTDTFTNQSFCDIKGANCWTYDENEANCNAEAGCNWTSSFHDGDSGKCDINETLYSTCFTYGSNSTACSADGNCSFVSFGGGGFCDAKPFSCMHSYFGNQSGCTGDSNCAWIFDFGAPGGGRCEAKCFSLNTTDCSADATCEQRDGFCEPEGFMGGGCFQNDGNRTACDALNKCTWTTDLFANNNVSSATTNSGNVSGWCDDSFTTQLFTGMQGGQPTMIATDSDGCGAGTSDENLSQQADICMLGIKDMDNSYGFGVMMGNISGSALCNGRPLQVGGVGSGTSNSSVYLYLDSDGNTTNNCNSDDNNQTGFEFKFEYEASWSSAEFTEVKLSYVCKNGTFAATNIGVSTWPAKSCKEIGALIVAVDKEALQAKSSFNKSEDMRLYATSSNVTGNEGIPVDKTEVGYYVQGSVDFKAEDCFGLVDVDGDGCLPSEDPDCELINKFGFIPFEDCYNGVDDNNDGLSDCDDPVCKYDPFACGTDKGGIGGLKCDSSDNTPPTLAFTKVHAMPDGAMIMADTFEPSNASIKFYVNDSTCSTLNTTILETKKKPWHDLPLDNFGQNDQALGYSLSGNVTYYYKYSLCDICNNCLVSACSSFTTPATYDACGKKCQTYIDDMDFVPPYEDITKPLGNLTIKYDLGGDGTYDYTKTPGQASSQETLNNTGKVSIKLENPSSTKNWSIECVNGTIPATVTFNSSNLDINDTEGNGLVGMPTSEYKNKFISNFDCEQICITVPYNGSDLFHCSNTSSNSCTNVTSNATKRSETTNSSDWCVDPEVLGFSYYQSNNGALPTSSSSSTSGSTSSSTGSSGGSSGGGISGGGSNIKTVVVNANQLSAGYTKALAANSRFKFEVGQSSHSMTVNKVTDTTAEITVQSTPQNATLTVGETKMFELNGDQYYDLSVHLLGIADSKANFTIKQVNTLITVEAEPEESTETVEETTAEEATPEVSSKEEVSEEVAEKRSSLVTVLIAIVLAVLIFFYVRRK